MRFGGLRDMQRRSLIRTVSVAHAHEISGFVRDGMPAIMRRMMQK
jgi:hypothetical protein